MKQITNIRKAVCAIANQLRKTGLSLSAAFAWRGQELSCHDNPGSSCNPNEGFKHWMKAAISC